MNLNKYYWGIGAIGSIVVVGSWINYTNKLKSNNMRLANHVHELCKKLAEAGLGSKCWNNLYKYIFKPF